MWFSQHFIAGHQEYFVSVHEQLNEFEFELDDQDGTHVVQIMSLQYAFDRIRLVYALILLILPLYVESMSRTNMRLFIGLHLAGAFHRMAPRYPPWKRSSPWAAWNTLLCAIYCMLLISLQEHPKFSILSLFANPMLLMSGVTLLMVFLIPKMKDAITDPEIIKVSLHLDLYWISL